MTQEQKEFLQPIIDDGCKLQGFKGIGLMCGNVILDDNDIDIFEELIDEKYLKLMKGSSSMDTVHNYEVTEKAKQEYNG